MRVRKVDNTQSAQERCPIKAPLAGLGCKPRTRTTSRPSKLSMCTDGDGNDLRTNTRQEWDVMAGSHPRAFEWERKGSIMNRQNDTTERVYEESQ